MSQKIIFWDVEMSLAKAGFFPNKLYRSYINLNHIIEEQKMVCICWKELGKSKVHSASILDDGDMSSDLNVIKTFRDVVEDADILVAHNGNRFDIKLFNAKLMEHGLPPMPKLLTVDTIKESRSVAKLISHKLDYLGDFFGVGRKIHNNRDLWRDILFNQDTDKALSQMVRYCKQDVKLLEKVYFKMLPYMKSHPNIADFHTMNCPKCNSSDVIKHKKRISAQGILKQQYQCKCCGSYFTQRTSEKEKSFSKL